MLGCGSGGVATINCIFPLMTNIIYWLLFFSGAVALVIIILSGIRFIISGGESKSVETAKKSMTYAVFGLLLVFLAFLIINVIAFVTGVACIKGSADGSSASLLAPFQTCEGGVSGGSSGGGWGSSYPPCEPTYKCVSNSYACSGVVVGGRTCNISNLQTCCDAAGGGSTASTDCPTHTTPDTCEGSATDCVRFRRGQPDGASTCTVGGGTGICCKY
jgi:hypothetical protein